MIEVVIDGTNFGGKTPLVQRLLERIRERGKSVATASPYREVEVYGLWDDAPEDAAAQIAARMAAHRESAGGVDVFVWDRGWPTCFMSTRNAAARRLFWPLPRLSFLLLNTAAATEKKVRKYGLSEEVFPWMFRKRLRDEISYEDLARLFADDLRVFRPTLEDDRFDLELVSGEILAEIEAEAREPLVRRGGLEPALHLGAQPVEQQGQVDDPAEAARHKAEAQDDDAHDMHPGAPRGEDAKQVREEAEGAHPREEEPGGRFAELFAILDEVVNAVERDHQAGERDEPRVDTKEEEDLGFALVFWGVSGREGGADDAGSLGRLRHSSGQSISLSGIVR